MSGVLLCCLVHQAHRGVPLAGVLLCSSVHWVFDGPVSLFFSCWCWCVGRERPWRWLHPLRMTQQYRLASVAAWLSSTGIFHHDLLSHTPSICLSAVNSSLHPGIAPQSLNSSTQPLHLPGDLCPCLGCVGCSNNCLIPFPFRLPQTSCFTLSLKCFSSDSDNCPNMEIGPLLQFSHPPRAGPVLLTLLFFPLVPLSYQVLRGSIYSFSTGQVLLSALSWFSASTSVSESAFLMYPWREMYSMSTCSQPFCSSGF